MNLTVSTPEVDLLRAAQEALLSPLMYGEPTIWQAQVARAVRTFLEADHAVFVLPQEDDLLIYNDDADPGVVDAFRRVVTDLEPGLIATSDAGLNHAAMVRRRKGSGVYHEVMFGGDEFKRRSRFYQEVMAPAGLRYLMVLSAPMPRGEAMLVVAFEQQGARLFGEEGRLRLEMLLSAFVAGVRVQGDVAARRMSFEAALDALPAAVAVCAPEGREIHRNQALRQILFELTDERPIHDKIRELARTLGTRRDTVKRAGKLKYIPTLHHVKIDDQQFLLCGSYLAPGIFPTASVLVSIEPLTISVPPPAKIRAHFDLTNREAEVAHRIARGQSTRDIAAELYISVNTVRRHTEHIMKKLGLHSRSAVSTSIISKHSHP